MENKKQTILFGAVAVIALLLSVFGFISSTRSQDSLSKTLLTICSVLLLALTLIYITVVALSKENGQNFFLYDASAKKNQSEKHLAFEHVANRTDAFIESVGGADKLLLKKELINGDFGMGSVLRPVVAYRLLQYAAKDSKIFDMIHSLDDKTLAVLCQSLELAGEADLPAALIRYRERGGNADNFLRFLNGNYKYIQNKMMSYVLRNLELFY